MPEKIYSEETEEYGQAEAQSEALWQERYGAKLPELCGRIDEILAGVQEERISRLEELLGQKEIKKNYKAVEEIAAVSIALKIYEQEMLYNEKGNIFTGIRSIEQIEKRLQKMRFAVYRMEFFSGEDSEIIFQQCMEEEQLTVTAAVSVVIMAAVYPVRVVLRLEDTFWKHRMYGKELLLLEIIRKKWPGNQRLTRRLSDLYTAAGREAYARIYRKELVKYTDIREISVEAVYLLQERVWRIRYGDTEAARECTELIEEEPKLENILAEIISQEKNWQADEYLLAANAWFAEGKDMQADKTLETGNKATAGEVRKKLQELRTGGKESHER